MMLISTIAGTGQYEAVMCITPPAQMLGMSVGVMLVMVCVPTVSGKPCRPIGWATLLSGSKYEFPLASPRKHG